MIFKIFDNLFELLLNYEKKIDGPKYPTLQFFPIRPIDPSDS
jgi:hypothetical protein